MGTLFEKKFTLILSLSLVAACAQKYSLNNEAAVSTDGGSSQSSSESSTELSSSSSSSNSSSSSTSSSSSMLSSSSSSSSEVNVLSCSTISSSNVCVNAANKLCAEMENLPPSFLMPIEVNDVTGVGLINFSVEVVDSNSQPVRSWPVNGVPWIFLYGSKINAPQFSSNNLYVPNGMAYLCRSSIPCSPASDDFILGIKFPPTVSGNLPLLTLRDSQQFNLSTCSDGLWPPTGSDITVGGSINLKESTLQNYILRTDGVDVSAATGSIVDLNGIIYVPQDKNLVFEGGTFNINGGIRNSQF